MIHRMHDCYSHEMRNKIFHKDLKKILFGIHIERQFYQ